MKIVDIEMMTVEVPLVPLSKGGIAPYVGSKDFEAGTTAGTSFALSTIFKVMTDEGICGWGEMNPIVSLKISKIFLEEFIKPIAIGKDPFEIKQITNKLNAVYNPQIYVKTFICGVEMACWDIMGKAINRPVHDLLGGKIRDRVEIAYCLGMLDMEETKEKIRQIKNAGFKCVKTKGGNNVLVDIKRTAAIREAGGEDFAVRMDVNQSYDMITALQYLHGVEDCNLQYIEQPIPISRFDDLKSLRERTTVPIAINEDCYMPGNLFECVKRNAIDAAVVDLEQAGGIYELKKSAIIAQEAGVPLAHHCGFDMGIKTAAILHTVCAIPAFSYAMDSTYHAHEDDVLAERIKVENGCYIVPDGPGLGIEIDEQKLKYYAIDDCSRRFI